jgi:non-ribosomal peptide synthetase component F
MTIKESSRDVQADATARQAFVFPLSFGQRRLWFLHQFDEASPAYNIPIAMRLRTPLNRSVLERAVNEIVRRHEILRTTFQTIDGEPMQVVAPALTMTVAYSDLRSTPADQKDAAAANLAFLDAQQPFQLKEGPLLRVGMHRLGETDHLLLISMHHIVSDGWSVDVLFRELNALYSALSTGKPSPLAELPLQYADFAHWQSQTLKGQTLEKLHAYWRQHLAGVPELLELPADRARPSIPSGRGGAHSTAVSASLYGSVRSLGQRARATPFMVLLAIFEILLFRHTGATDLVIGTPIANRTKPQLEDLIGLFVNTLVIRTDLSGDPTFLGLLARVREAALAAFAHQDMPFELLVEQLQPARSLAQNPLFQVMFLLQSADRSSAIQAGSHGPRPVHVATTAAKFDLTVSVVEMAEAAHVTVEYNADLFDNDTVKRLTDRFIALIESAVGDPHARLSALRLCGPAELRIVQPVVGPAAAADGAAAVWQRVEHWADTQPDAIAIACSETAISYRELATRVGERARELLAQGVAEGCRVAVGLDFSIEMAVVMLAASKIGAVFVPSVSGANVGVPSGTPACSEDGNAGNGNTVACILRVPGKDGHWSGVEVPHAALSRTDFGHGLRITASDRVLLCAHFEDEFAVFEMLATLAAGAQLVLLSASSAPSPRSLAALLREHRATIAIAPVQTLDRVARDFPWALKDIRAAVWREEATALDGIEEALLRKLFLVDGAAEAGGYVFVRRAWDGAAAGMGSDLRSGSGLGSVAAGVTVHLLDGAMRPAADGAVGEIFVESRFLASGYHANPDATAIGFPGSFHRSGQLARRSSHGALIGCGRRDRRMRIRGGRIEPEAVEAALRQHPQIGEVAVVRGRRGLSAYLVAAASGAPAEDELIAFCRDRLAAAAIPASWRVVAALPRAPGGQTDMPTLQRQETERESGATTPEYVAPRNDIERRIAGLWATALGPGPIGIGDNFFKIGGHSLLAVRIVAQIADDHRLALSLKDFFTSPTIEGLAALVARNGSGSAKPVPPAIARIEGIIPTDRPPNLAELTEQNIDDMLAELLGEQSGLRAGAP